MIGRYLPWTCGGRLAGLSHSAAEKDVANACNQVEDTSTEQPEPAALTEAQTTDAQPTKADLLNSELADMLEQFIDITYVPEKECRCHIAPPCSDCVEHAYTRALLEDAKALIKKARGA